MLVHQSGGGGGGGKKNTLGGSRFLQFQPFLGLHDPLTILSARDLLPGNLSMALIILASAFHLSGRVLARL